MIIDPAMEETSWQKAWKSYESGRALEFAGRASYLLQHLVIAIEFLNCMRKPHICFRIGFLSVTWWVHYSPAMTPLYRSWISCWKADLIQRDTAKDWMMHCIRSSRRNCSRPPRLTDRPSRICNHYCSAGITLWNRDPICLFFMSSLQQRDKANIHYARVLDAFQEQEINEEFELLIPASDRLWDSVHDKVSRCSFLIICLRFFLMLLYSSSWSRRLVFHVSQGTVSVALAEAQEMASRKSDWSCLCSRQSRQQ